MYKTLDVKKIIKALEFYADGKNWTSNFKVGADYNVIKDDISPVKNIENLFKTKETRVCGGKLAREVLESMK